MPIDIDTSTADGNREWGMQLVAEGQLDDAARAFEMAAKLDPLNASRYFEHGEILVASVEQESPYFRDQGWARAQQVVERGGELDPQNVHGVELYERILRSRMADREETVDETPMRLLEKGSTQNLEVRPTGETKPISSKAAEAAWLFNFNARSGGAIVLLAVVLIRGAIWGLTSIFTWTTFALVVATVVLVIVGFRVIYGDRLEDRRDDVSF